MRDVTAYPFVFFPVGLNLRNRRCVVIGADREAIEKAERLREVGAEVVRLTDASRVRDEDLVDAFLVISTPQDAALSKRLRALADEHRFLLCCIDQPTFGFIAMQATADAGPVRIAISTGGVAPRVGKAFKEAFGRALDETFVRFIACLNAQRERNRDRFDRAEDRRAAMIEAAQGFGVEVALRYPEWFEEGRSLESTIVQAYAASGRTIATAESITGGGIADTLVRVPGASRCFRGGVVAYDDAVKTDFLGVDTALLREHGAVSEQVAAAMALGMRTRAHTDFALATTGVAGPTGGSARKPTGLTWFALALPTGAVDTYSVTFPGEREDVRRAAVRFGLRLLRQGVEARLE